MLLSDRDIKAEVVAGRFGFDLYDEALVRPSSIDVRLDRMFRVFENDRCPHIDRAEAQDDLTRLAETADDEPFILHPCRVRAGLDVWSHRPCLTTSRRALRARARVAGSGCSPTRPPVSPIRDFSGHVTLAPSNVAMLPIKLWPGMRIGHGCVFQLTSPAEHPYGSSI